MSILTPYLLFAQADNTQSWTLEDANQVTIHGAKVSPSEYQGKKSLRVDHVQGEGEAHFAKLIDCDFSDGIIELELAGRPAENAGQGARGFVGLAFRIAENNSYFECFYLVPGEWTRVR